jgi:hypothetical protein
MFNDNIQWLGTAEIIFGMALAFAGHMYPQHSIFIASYNLGVYIMIIPFFSLFMDGVNEWFNFLATPIIMFIGVIPAYFLAKYEKVGIIWMSTVCGALFGTLIDLTA